MKCREILYRGRKFRIRHNTLFPNSLSIEVILVGVEGPNDQYGSAREVVLYPNILARIFGDSMEKRIKRSVKKTAARILKDIDFRNRWDNGIEAATEGLVTPSANDQTTPNA